MNDFTKEELKDIYDAVMDTDIAMFEYLPKKIQSMIDNYQENECLNGHTEYPDIALGKMKCMNCDWEG